MTRSDTTALVDVRYVVCAKSGGLEVDNQILAAPWKDGMINLDFRTYYGIGPSQELRDVRVLVKKEDYLLLLIMKTRFLYQYKVRLIVDKL